MSWTSRFLLNCVGNLVSCCRMWGRTEHFQGGWACLLRQGRRERSRKRQCLGSDTVQCVYINDHRAENKCVLMIFVVASRWEDMTLSSRRAGCSGRQELQKRWNSTGQNANLCSCRLVKTFAYKMGFFFCLCGFIHINHGMLIYC